MPQYKLSKVVIIQLTVHHTVCAILDIPISPFVAYECGLTKKRRTENEFDAETRRGHTKRHCGHAL